MHAQEIENDIPYFKNTGLVCQCICHLVLKIKLCIITFVMKIILINSWKQAGHGPTWLSCRVCNASPLHVSGYLNPKYLDTSYPLDFACLHIYLIFSRRQWHKYLIYNFQLKYITGILFIIYGNKDKICHSLF